MTDMTVIGLGQMGAALARTLLASRRTVTVWNRSAEKAGPLLAAGAQLATTLEEAVAASPACIICIKTHATTTELLAPLGDRLKGKAILDLSTGGAGEAETLVAMLTANGASWLIGMINAYPSGVGQADTAILCAGPDEVWAAQGDAIRALGGRSAHVGTTPSAIPALFAAMFTARQGFMFGMIYGGAVAKRAGLDLKTFAAQIPITHGVAGSYGKLFANTVPEAKYDNAEATMEVYRLALEDVLGTFKETGTPDALPRLMLDLTAEAVADGHDLKQLTYLVERLAKG